MFFQAWKFCLHFEISAEKWEKSTGNWVKLSVKFCNFCWNCFIRQNIKDSLILEFNLLSTKHILNLNFEEISSITTVSSDLFARDLSVQLKFVYTQFSSNFMEADWRWQKCETNFQKIRWKIFKHCDLLPWFLKTLDKVACPELFTSSSPTSNNLENSTFPLINT